MAVKFIKILFIFLLPLVIAYTCTEYLLSAAENIYTVKKRMLEQEKDSLQVLIAGTSQTFHSLNPALFNRPSLNLAAPTQPLYYDCQIILKHLSQLKKLRLVIIPIDYITLFSDANKNSYYLLNYYHFWNIDNPVLSKTDVRRYSLLAYFKPATCREMIAEMITEKKINIRMEDKEMLDNGFEPLDAPADTSRFDESAAKLMGNWNATQLSKNYFDGNTKRLNELINTLQEKKIKRVGENIDRTINCRIISATHKDLAVEITQKRFREDLFFRLNVIPILIPPLRERSEDLLPLAEFFLRKYVISNMFILEF